MKMKTLLFSTVTVLALVISACGSSSAPAAEAMMEKETPTADVMMSHETPTGETMMHDETATPEVMMDDAMMKSPAWYSISLNDTRSGQAFSIESLKGKVVLVETMAVWCSKCLNQQGQLKILHENLGQRDDFVSIGLDIDPNENEAQLKDYVEAKGFNWLYAVSPADVSREIASLHGNQFLNPPSTPILVIDRHGVSHPMPFGFKSADDLLKFIQPFLDESM